MVPVSVSLLAASVGCLARRRDIVHLTKGTILAISLLRDLRKGRAVGLSRRKRAAVSTMCMARKIFGGGQKAAPGA
jgi:hypothetical protein